MPSTATASNHRLTATTGLVLVPLLGLVYLTGLAMDAYWHAHYVIGFVLIPVVALKLAATGWRAIRYYTGSQVYRAAGPPQLGLRLMAPFLVAGTALALGTGVALFAEHSRTGTLSTLHTDSAVVTAGLVGIHFLAYIQDAARSALAELRRLVPRGRAARVATLLLALAAGAVIAGLTYADGTWPARRFHSDQVHPRWCPGTSGRRLARAIVPLFRNLDTIGRHWRCLAMPELITYRLDGPVATVTMDDGKVNVLSPAMLAQLDAALDRARDDGAVVLLRGRDGVFSAGFDLNILGDGGPEAIAMVRAGFELAYRLLGFPTPVIVACTGHAVAMGAFLLLSGDYRVGASGPYKVVANEVANHITMPHAAIEICRQRLAPAHFSRVVLLSETYTPDDAVAAGFLDRVVAPAQVSEVAQTVAAAASTLDLAAHAASKQRARAGVLDALRAAIAVDGTEGLALTSASRQHAAT